MRTKILLVLFVGLLGCAALAKAFVFDLTAIGGDDMAPSLFPGDLILGNRLAGQPRRGDLVLFEHPTHPAMLVRRVIGLPGETFELRHEVPVVAGKAAERRELGAVTLEDRRSSANTGGRAMRRVLEQIGDAGYEVLRDPGRRSRDTPKVKLEDSYYLLSDNRNHGTDSRELGPVPAGRIRAIITHRLKAGRPTIAPAPARADFVSLR